MISRQRLLRECLFAAGFLILPLLLYWNVTVGGQTMIPADNLYQWQPWATYADEFGATVPDNALLSDLVIQNYVWKGFIRETVRSGDIPLWNPYLFAGAPFLATGQNAAYYPFGFLFILLPLTQAYGWYTLSQLWLAGLCMGIFMRVMRLRPWSALISGVIFQGSGFFLVSAAVFPMMIGAAAWLPLCLAALEKVIGSTTSEEGDGKTLPWAAFGAFTVGMQILAGHIEITYYTLLIMAFFALWRLVSRFVSGRWHIGTNGERWRRLIRPPVWLLVTVVVGLMLGGIQFIPFYEVGTTNFREGSASFEQVLDWGYPPRRVLTFALPDFFGNPADHHYMDAFTGDPVPFTTNYYGQINPHGGFSSNWGIKNYVEGGVYLGILPLFLAAIGLISGLWIGKTAERDAGRGHGRTRSAVGFFAVLSFFSLAFIFGTPLYAILYYGFPGLNQLHSPFRWVFPLALAVAALAGYGLESLRALNRAPQRWTRLASWAVIAGGGLILIGLYASRIFYDALEPIIEPIFLDLAQAADAFPSTRAFYSYQFTNVQHFGLMVLASGIVLRVAHCPIYLPEGLTRFFRAPEATKIPVFLPLAALVLIADLWFIGFGFNASTDPALLDFKPELIRWLEQQPDSDQWRVTSFDNKGSKPFNANSAWLTGFQDVRGYDSIIAKQYTEYMAAIEPQNELKFNRIQPIGDWQAINSPLIDLLTVKYIITEETLELPKLALAWEGEGLRVYENLAVMPRAYTLSRDAAVFSEDQLAAMTTVDPRFTLVVSRPELESYALGATADPQPVTITRYTNRQVMIDVQVDEPSWLVINDSYFPGWRAFVRPFATGEQEEQSTDVHRVNGNFRAILLEPGEWTVRWQYTPFTFWLGLLTSAIGTVIVMFAFTVWGWRRFYRQEGELTNTRSIAKNSVAPMALNLFNRGIDFLFAAYYLRLLGPADSGAYATAIAIAGLYEILSNFGLNAYLIREVSQDKQKTSSYLLNTTVLRLGTGALASLPILLYVWGTGYSPNTIAAVVFLMVGMVFSGMAAGLTGLFYAYEEAEIPATITTVTTILKVGFGVVVLFLGFGFVGLAANSILVNIITLILLIIIVIRRYPLSGPWRVDFPLQRKMLLSSYPLMINHLLATIYWQVDVLILNQVQGDEVVGWYNSAYKYVNALNIIPSFFTFALFPVISRQVQSDLAAARRTFRMSAKLLMLVALPLASFVTLLAPIMITLLGGSAFIPDGQIALQVVIWSIPFGWLNSVTNYVLISLGQERVQTRAFIIGVGFNIVGNILIIPILSYVGAGLTTIASEILLLGLFNYYLLQKMPSVKWGELLWRLVAVTAVMIGSMLAIAQWNLWVALAAGAVIYPAGLILLKVFGEDEQRILKTLLPESITNRLTSLGILRV